MRRFLVVGLALLSAPAVAGTLDQPILGGTQATVGQYPTVVAVDLGNALCTGTLIDKDWVLTAAHCVQGMSPGQITIHFNTINIFQSAGKTVGASMAVAKPEFNLSTLGSNDIGLIKLSQSVTDITPLPVNLYAAKAPVGIKVTMVGFGATAVGGGGNIGIEYVVDQTSVSCSSMGESDASLLCFNQTSGKGKCEGDSGGPSFAMIDGKLTQVGITSFGDQNCAQFGADTRTDAERAFLLKYIPQLECSTDADCPTGRECFLHKCITQPFSPTGLGTSCTTGTDCDSTVCASNGDKSYCTMTCTPGQPDQCPSGLECQAAGASGACWPEHTGCCDASGQGAPTMMFGIAFVGLVWRRRRRR